MTFTINAKPLSINEAYKGRHFPTAAKTQFEHLMRLLLPKRVAEGKWFRVRYDFHLKNFSLTDTGNLEKILTDCIVNRGIISDDRLITELTLRKHPSDRDWIEVHIEPTEIERAPLADESCAC